MNYSLGKGLKVVLSTQNRNYKINTVYEYSYQLAHDSYKNNASRAYLCTPILRPLSDLTKPIEHKGEVFVPVQRLFNAENQGIEFRYDEKGLISSLKRIIIYGKHESFDGEENIGYLPLNYRNMFFIKYNS